MTCQAARERIIEIAGRAALEPEVQAHLRSCQACAEVEREQQALWRQLDAWAPPPVSAGFDQRLYRRLEGRAGAWSWLGQWLRPVQPAFAAALACLVLAAGLVVERSREAPVPEKPVVSWDREDLRQIDSALDDMEMLNDFEILPVAGEGKS